MIGLTLKNSTFRPMIKARRWPSEEPGILLKVLGVFFRKSLVSKWRLALESERKFDLVVINPSVVIGPLLLPKPSNSHEVTHQIN